MWQWLTELFSTGVPHGALKRLEERLVAIIPAAVQQANLGEPVYCMRIWYNGTDSDSDAVPWLMLVKESTRQQLFLERGERAAEVIWLADELTLPGQAFEIFLEGRGLEGPYTRWYRYLAAVEDDEAIQPLREMVQRVSRRLNELNWRERCPVTEDFVIFPADGSHTFWDDQGEMRSSVTTEQRERLMARKLLPPSIEPDREESE